MTSIEYRATDSQDQVTLDTAQCSTLILRALSWLDKNGSVENRVPVANGNEAAFSFYQKFGFYPRRTILEQKKNPLK
ncbi:MAG: hypothetical protein JXQ82_09630 [Methanomicrobiaceae archaeon]|nr:hypothetical protein [Methanomicrobiaceae archaeon]